MNKNLEKVFAQRVVREDSRKIPQEFASIHPEVDELDHVETPEIPPSANGDEEHFGGLDWDKVPHLQRRAYEHSRGSKPSWIYLYGWPVWHRKLKKKFWLCKYCHQHNMSKGEYNVDGATTSAAAHLSQRTRGHGIGKDGLINFTRLTGQSSLLATLQLKDRDIS